MQGVTQDVTAHHLVLNVGLYDFRNRVLNSQEGKPAGQLDDFLLVRVVSFLELIQHGCAGYKEVTLSAVVPPLAGPFTTSDHVWLGSGLVIKAWDGCLDIDFRLHDERGLSVIVFRAFVGVKSTSLKFVA